MVGYKAIRYKHIKNQHRIISQIAHDLFSDPFVRSQFLAFITSYPYPLNKMILLHYEHGEKDEVKKYKRLINQADKKIQLKNYPPEIRKLF